jgi:hypothetical protein
MLIYLKEAVAMVVVVFLFICLAGYLSIRTNDAEKDFPNKSETAL